MPKKELPPMAGDGVWLHLPHKGPEYVVHEAHIRRLLSEGAQVVGDPRVPEDEAPAPTPAPSATEVAMQSRIDQLEAMIQQLLAQKSEQSDASTSNDVSTDSTSAQNDSRSSRRKSGV